MSWVLIYYNKFVWCAQRPPHSWCWRTPRVTSMSSTWTSGTCSRRASASTSARTSCAWASDPSRGLRRRPLTTTTRASTSTSARASSAWASGLASCAWAEQQFSSTAFRTWTSVVVHVDGSDREAGMPSLRISTINETLGNYDMKVCLIPYCAIDTYALLIALILCQ